MEIKSKYLRSKLNNVQHLIIPHINRELMGDVCLKDFQSRKLIMKTLSMARAQIVY